MTIMKQQLLTNIDINELQQLKRKELIASYHKIRMIGLFIIIISMLIFSLIGFDMDNKNRLFYTLNSLFFGYGICAFFVPNILRIANVEKIFFFEYSEAYINMPKMELWKEYNEDIKKQGRKLTNSECDLIIKSWNNLI